MEIVNNTAIENPPAPSTTGSKKINSPKEPEVKKTGILKDNNNKYGFINENEETILNFEYDEIIPFKNNNQQFYIVRKGSNYGAFNSVEKKRYL